ncbi:hypothetical protein [Chloroflexus sp.]|uniref:hypothetical protein n=1 Tax=Chloroflexus sp. TaxID=1904827 RepID=UPI00404B9C0C
MRRLFSLSVTVALLVVLVGCGANQSGVTSGGITVRDPWVRAAMMNIAGDQSGAMGDMGQYGQSGYPDGRHGG